MQKTSSFRENWSPDRTLNFLEDNIPSGQTGTEQCAQRPCLESCHLTQPRSTAGKGMTRTRVTRAGDTESRSLLGGLHLSSTFGGPLGPDKTE